MVKPIIAVVGCGRMGSLLTNKLVNSYQVFVYDKISTNALELARVSNATVASIEDLKKANVIILALATEILPKAVDDLEKYLAEDGILVNIATTLTHREIKTKHRLVSAKIVGHAKEMALGEEPVIVIEGDDPSAQSLVAEIFGNVGKVVIGNSDIVSQINTIASKYGIIAGIEIKNALKEFDLPEEVVISAIRIVAAGTMKAYAVGDLGPFARKIVEEYEKEK